MKLKTVLKDKRGISSFIGTLIGILILSMFLTIMFAAQKNANAVTRLNEFGDQMLYTVTTSGRTDGDVVQKRYQELCTATGLKPEIIYDGTQYIPGTKKVQYGDTIKMRIKLQNTLSALGVHLPYTVQIQKSGNSQQYWKVSS